MNVQNDIETGSIRAAPHPYDVVMIVKQYVASQTLAQKPLLVLRKGRAARVPELVLASKHHGSTAFLFEC